MVTGALGGNQERRIPAGVSLASAHNAEPESLCGSSSAVPHLSNSICRFSRSAVGCKSIVSPLRWFGSFFLLLAARALSRSLRTCLVNCVAGVFGSISLSNEHGQSAAARDCLPDHCNSPVFQA